MNLLKDTDIGESFARDEENLKHISSKVHEIDDNISSAANIMRGLEWNIMQAECNLAREKEATYQVGNEMLEFLKEIDNLEGEAWNYIRQVIQQWVHNLQFHGVVLHSKRFGGSKFISMLRKRRYGNRVSKRRKIKFAFIEKNIQAAKLTKLKNNIRLPKLSKEDEIQLEGLVKTETKDEPINEYRFQQTELTKLKEVNSKLLLQKCGSDTMLYFKTLNKNLN